MTSINLPLVIAEDERRFPSELLQRNILESPLYSYSETIQRGNNFTRHSIILDVISVGFGTTIWRLIEFFFAKH